jgi:phage terminase small subunit
MPELKNLRHEQFCQEYSKRLNATESYKQVYNAKQITCETNGPKLLENTLVHQRIKELMQDRTKRVEGEGDVFLEQLKYSSLFDPKEVFHFSGETVTFKSFDEIPIEARRMIASVKARNYRPKEGDPYTEIEVKFLSKEKMMELWGRHKGHYNDKLNVTQTITLEKLIGDSLNEPGQSKP